MIERICDQCKQPYQAKSILSRYCSSSCKLKHFREEQAKSIQIAPSEEKELLLKIQSLLEEVNSNVNGLYEEIASLKKKMQREY